MAKTKLAEGAEALRLYGGLAQTAAAAFKVLEHQIVRVAQATVTLIGGAAVGAFYGLAAAGNQLQDTLLKTVGAFRPAHVDAFTFAIRDLQAVLGVYLEPILVQVIQSIRYLSGYFLAFYEANRPLIGALQQVIGKFAAWLVTGSALTSMLQFLSTILAVVAAAFGAVVAAILLVIGSVVGLTVSIIGLTVTIVGLIAALIGLSAAVAIPIALLLVLAGVCTAAVIAGLNWNNVLMQTVSLLQRIGIAAGYAAAATMGMTKATLDYNIAYTKLMLGKLKLVMPTPDKILDAQKKAAGMGVRNVSEVQEAADIGKEARISMLKIGGEDPMKDMSADMKEMTRIMEAIFNAWTSSTGVP